MRFPKMRPNERNMKDESPASQNSHAARRGSAGKHQGAARKNGWQTKTLGEVSTINYGYIESLSENP
jgi:hypothetical protein